MNGTALALSVSLGFSASSALAPPTALIEPAPSYAEYEAQLIEASAAATEARESDLSSATAHEAYAKAVALVVGAYAALPPADRSTELGGDIVTLTHGLMNSQRVGAALWRMSPEEAELWLPIFDAAIALHRQHLESGAAADEPRMAKHRSGLEDLEAARGRVAKVASPAPEQPEPDPEPVAEAEEPQPPPPVARAETQTDAPPVSRRGLVIGLAVGGGVLVATSIGTLVGGLNIRNSRESAETAYGREGLLDEPEVVTFLDDESRRAQGLLIATGVLAGVGLGAIVAAIVVKKRASSKHQASRGAPQVAATPGGFQVRF